MRRGKYYKFCAECGLQITGEAKRLENHCRVHHEGSNKGFLKFDELPPSSIYKNFTKYLMGHADQLVPDPELQQNKRGRKPGNTKVDKIIEQMEI